MNEQGALQRAWGGDRTKRPVLVPLGDQAMLVRFGDSLSEPSNMAALAFAARLEQRPIKGVLEVVPTLVSVMLRYDPRAISFQQLAGEVGLLMTIEHSAPASAQSTTDISVSFAEADAPDLEPVASALGLTVEEFVAAHNSVPLRVLTTGFAPGFVYCGFHPEHLRLPRKQTVRQEVPAGSVLFAAGQTAIAATNLPTGWHVIGRTDFRNFMVDQEPPTLLQAGDFVRFVAGR